MKKLWILQKSLLGILMIVPILVLISTGVAHADRWAIAYGTAQSDQAYSVQQTADGGFVVAGVTDTSGSSAAWVLKLDANGGIEWQKTYGGADTNYVVYSIQQTSDGGYILAGETDASGTSDAWILKLNPDGTVKWQNTYGGSFNVDRAYSIQQTSDKGYIVAGVTYSFGLQNGDFWVLKLNMNGNVGPSFAGTWQKAYDIGLDDTAHSIHQTSDGGYIVAGVTGLSATSDALVMKLRPNGNVKWKRTYGGSNADLANSVQETSGGEYIVAGETSSFGAGSSDLWVLNLDSNGNVNWEKTYGGSNADLGRSVQETSDGGYVVAGETSSFGAGNSDFWVLRIDKNGEIPGCGDMGTSSLTSATTSATIDNPTAVILSTTVSNKKSSASATNTGVSGDEVCSHQEPDLIISSLSAPFSVSKGVAFDVKDTTKNIGSAGTGITTTTSFYLSGDNILDGSDTLIGSRSVPALGAGTSDTDTTSVTIPPSTVVGNYYIIAKADDSDDVIEGVENNNTYVKAISIMKVTLLVPNGREVIASGGNWAICWNAPITAEKYTLDYSTDDGANWNLIKTVTGLNCTKWEVPVVSMNKKKCRVRVTALDSGNVSVGSDMSDKPFTIEVIRVTSPNGGETLTASSSWIISWLTNKTINPVAQTILQYSTNGGATWKPIITLSGNPGSYLWTVPNDPSATCKVKVVLKNSGGTSVGSDISNKVFKIQ